MAAITEADVLELFPELERVPAIILAWVNSTIAVDVFDGENGPTTKIVRCLLAAHIVKATGIDGQGGGGSSGPITSETEGGISRSWGSLSQNNDTGLGVTGYGVQLRMLMRWYAGGAWLATM